MIKSYFPMRERQPQPLKKTISRTVRFEEVDPLGIVWHGRYASYFEDARVALGETYGIGYMDFYNHNVVAPIKQMHLDYLKPLRYRDTMSIEAIWHWSEAVRINYEFIIKNENGDLATTGYTVQMMLDFDDNILVVPPPFYEQLKLLAENRVFRIVIGINFIIRGGSIWRRSCTTARTPRGRRTKTRFSRHSTSTWTGRTRVA